MDKKTAKQEVLDFMRSHKTSDIAELHENIKCDIAMLIEIIDELCKEENIAHSRLHWKEILPYPRSGRL